MEVVTASSSFDITSLLIVVGGFIAALLISVGLLFFLYPYLLGWIKFRKREHSSLEFVLLQITVPRANEVKIDAAEQMMAAFVAINRSSGWFKMFDFLKAQPHISFEIVALPESIRFYVACHKRHQDLVEKQINGAYPDASVKEVPEYNIFSEAGEVAYSML